MPADETPQPAPSLIVVNDPAAAGPGQPAEGAEQRETVEEPAKVMRIGSMIKQLLEEVRSAPIDEASRAHLRDIYETSVKELTSGLSPDLAEELGRVKIPFQDGTPSEAELRIAQAQLVGWLEGQTPGWWPCGQEVCCRTFVGEAMTISNGSSLVLCGAQGVE